MEFQSIPSWVAISAAVIAILWLIVVVWALMTIHAGSRRVHRAGSDDTRSSLWSIPTPRWVLIITTAVVVLSLTLFALSLVGIYVGDDVMHPSVNERSVPPPRVF